MKTPHDVTWHLVFNVLHIAMHVNWQMTRRTDPGTIGLQDKGIYQSQYVQAIDEMCVQPSVPSITAVELLLPVLTAIVARAAACCLLPTCRCNAAFLLAGVELGELYEPRFAFVPTPVQRSPDSDVARPNFFGFVAGTGVE